MTATRPDRPWLDHIARLLIFVGVSGLLVGVPALPESPGSGGVWWLIAAFALFWTLGLVAQRFSTPIPLKTLSTPPGWPWLFAAIILFPAVLSWINWQWPWMWLLVVLAGMVGGWAAYLPVHRRREIHAQYRQRNETVSARPPE